jgi:hypothetical protein
MNPPKKAAVDVAPSSYGVREQRVVATDLDKAVEEITYLGYAVIQSGYSAQEISTFGCLFDMVQRQYVELYGEDFLRQIDEYNGIRLPLAFDSGFIDLAMNTKVLDLVRQLIKNEFILNQQNGVINPPGGNYNQGSWHRDLPYQHFVSSRPLAISALYCVDDFTTQNGATLVAPASHTQEERPSDSFMENNAKQITASAGSFIMLDSMVFHSGGANKTSSRRRGVNHVYTTAFIKQQIDIPSALTDGAVKFREAADLLNFKYPIRRSVADFLQSRRR